MPVLLLQAKASVADLWAAARFAIHGAWMNTRRVFTLLVVTSTLVALLPYAMGGLQALLFNELARVTTHHLAWRLIIELTAAIITIFVLRDLVSLAYAHAGRVLWHRVAQVRQIELSEKMLSLDMATHEDPKFKDELQVLNEYGMVYSISNFLDALVSSSQNVFGFVVASFIVLAIDWRLFILVVGLGIPRLYVEVKFGRNIWGFFHSQSGERRRFRELERHLDSPDSIAELQTFQSQGFFIGRMRTMLNAWFSGQIAEERKKFVLSAGAELLATIAIGIALVTLVYRTANGMFQIGTLVFAFQSMIGLQASVTGFFLSLSTVSRFGRPTNAYRKIMARSRAVPLPAYAVPHTFSRAPRIEFRQVSFSYPNQPERRVLNDFSLTIEPGERLALIGINGAGKSTLIKLLHRFYDPTEGQILVDGIDLRTLDLEEWYRVLALLSQEFSTYFFRVDEAISLGRSSAPRDQRLIEDAAVRAEADEFITKWDAKYGQQLGTQFAGIDPSGGQRQKLAIARTLYRDAFVTILDEPTAHVDAAAEQHIFERLYGTLGRDQTLIIISHRFSTIRNADRVCVVDGGRVAELGSHDELMALGGTYASLFSAQAEQYR